MPQPYDPPDDAYAALAQIQQQQYAYARLAGAVGGALSMRGQPFQDDGVILDRIAEAYARYEADTAGGGR